MKAIVILIIISPVFLFGQTDVVELPLKDNRIHFEKVGSLKGDISADEAFVNASVWLANSFVDSKDVIRLSDREAGKLIGAGLYIVRTGSAMNFREYHIHFMLDITLKDGKYRVQLYQFHSSGANNVRYPLEDIYERARAESKYRHRRHVVEMLEAVDERAKLTISSFSDAISFKDSL